MKTSMRRLGAAVLGAGALALTACGAPADGGAAQADEPIPTDPAEVSGEITYGIWDVNQQDAMEQIIAEFNEEYPDVAVNLQLTPWADYWTKLQAQASSRELPDVFWMNGPNFHKYAQNGQLAPLTPLVEQDLIDPQDYPAELTQLYTYDDVLYAAPKDYDTVAIWYNKALFDEAGVEYPDDTWTLETYKQKAVELHDALGDQGVWGCAEVLSNTASYYHSIPTAGGYVISEDGTASGYDDPKTIEGIRFWRDLIDSGACPDPQYMAENSAYALFESGKAAMQWSGNWRVSALKDSPVAAHVTVAPLPGGDDRKTAIHGIGNAISAHTENLAAAQVFVAFLAGERAAEISAETGAANPAFAGSQDAWVQAHPSFNLQVFIDQANENAVPFPVSANTSAWTQVESEYLTQVFAGEMSAEDAAARIAEEMNALLAEERE